MYGCLFMPVQFVWFSFAVSSGKQYHFFAIGFGGTLDFYRVKITTDTVWYNKGVRFSTVTLENLMDKIGRVVNAVNVAVKMLVEEAVNSLLKKRLFFKNRWLVMFSAWQWKPAVIETSNSLAMWRAEHERKICYEFIYSSNNSTTSLSSMPYIPTG